MDKTIAKELLWFVNDPQCSAALEIYVEYRLKEYRRQLETIKDFNRILEVQGAIAELKRFATLRDEVQAKKDQ